MYVIKARMHGCVRNDSETHSTGVYELHSRLRRSCNPVTQSRAFHCHFAHTRAFSLYSIISLKTTLVKFLPHLPGANQLNTWTMQMTYACGLMIIDSHKASKLPVNLKGLVINSQCQTINTLRQAKLLPFCRWYFQMHFLEGKMLHFDLISLKFVHKDLIEDKSALV